MEEKLTIMGLVEDKEKNYMKEAEEANLAYVFKNIEEFNKYFLEHGVSENNIGLATSALITIFPDGTVVAFKTLCDYVINKINSVKQQEKSKQKNRVKVLIPGIQV